VRLVSVVIADRHPLVICGLDSVLRAENDFTVEASCCSGAKCMQAIRDLVPDIALIDILMPDMSGLEILAAARSERLRTRIVFVGRMEPRGLITATSKGAYGVLPRDTAPEVLVNCLRQVAGGRRLLPIASWCEEAQAEQGSGTYMLAVLTERERQIMHLVSEGLSNKEVGLQLNISQGTIKVHLHRIYQKLAISNRTALAVLAFSHRFNL
jgi:two-component system nitrate/nitrite response regulator NarL